MVPCHLLTSRLRLAARDLTASDVVERAEEQNVEVPAGRLGQPPPTRNRLTRLRCALVRLTDPQELTTLSSDWSNRLVQLVVVLPPLNRLAC